LTASRPEAQKRLTVTPAIWTGSPARSTMALPSPVQVWADVHEK